MTTLSKQSKAEYGRRHKPGSRSNKLTVDLLTLKVVSKSRVTWSTRLPNLVFLGLCVLDLCPMYATDRRQTASSLNAYRGRDIISKREVINMFLEARIIAMLLCKNYEYWFRFLQVSKD